MLLHEKREGRGTPLLFLENSEKIFGHAAGHKT
jgi:hypothetical protein